MASEIKRGESVLIPFRNGKSIYDSQCKPRMYKTVKAFEKSFPGHYLGKDGVELVEYAEVVRCKDCKHWKPSGSMAGNREDDLQPIGGCEWANCCRKAMDFCSYGERKNK